MTRKVKHEIDPDVLRLAEEDDSSVRPVSRVKRYRIEDPIMRVDEDDIIEVIWEGALIELREGNWAPVVKLLRKSRPPSSRFDDELDYMVERKERNPQGQWRTFGQEAKGELRVERRKKRQETERLRTVFRVYVGEWKANKGKKRGYLEEVIERMVAEGHLAEKTLRALIKRGWK